MVTFGEVVRLNNIEKRVDHVEKDPDGRWFVVRMGIVNCRRYKPKVQRLHRRRGALSAGVRPHLIRCPVPLIRRLLAACGPPAEQQDEPPAPQHGSEKVCTQRKETRKEERRQPRRCAYSPAAGDGGRRWADDTCPSRWFISPAQKQPSKRKTFKLNIRWSTS